MSHQRTPTLTVTFHKVAGRSPHAWWEAVRTTRGRVRGGYMPIGRGRIPHDLGHMATEAHFGIDDGFWGLLARGATFKHGTHQRATRPGRHLIRDHRAGLGAAEAIGNEHHFAWAMGKRTPVGPTFDLLARLWEALPDGDTLTIQWPTLELADRSGEAPMMPRPGPAGHRRNAGSPAGHRTDGLRGRASIVDTAA